MDEFLYFAKRFWCNSKIRIVYKKNKTEENSYIRLAVPLQITKTKKNKAVINDDGSLNTIADNDVTTTHVRVLSGFLSEQCTYTHYHTTP